MKLRYYLRGLGIGMLVAALVLILSGNTGAKMDDEAVKRRAAQLGMVEKDKSVLGNIDSEAAAEKDTEADIQEGTPGVEVIHVESDEADSGEEEAQQAEETEPEEDAAGQAGEIKPEEKAADQGDTAQEADSEEQALAQEIEQRADEVADRAEEVAENSVPENTVKLDVRTGDSSVSVARRAAEAGLVQSAADFDVFLCQNGYDKRISIGSYEIPLGASEREIAEIITKSR